MPDKHSVLFVGRAQTYEDLRLRVQKMTDVDLRHEESSTVEDMKKVHTDVILIEPANTHEHTCSLLDEVGAKHPDSIMMLMTPQKPEPDKLLQYMNYGIRDIVTNDDNPEQFLQKAIALLGRRAAAGHAAGTVRSGKAVCFFSAKGGVGKTFLALSTARLISQNSAARIIMVDLDLQFGDLDLYLDANSMQTLGELIEEVKNNGDRFSDFILDSHVHQVTPGLHLLSAPLSPEKAELINGSYAAQLIKILKKKYDVVILDTGAVLNEVILTAFDKSDRIFLVMNDEIASVKNAGQTFQLMKKLNYPDTKVDFVVNGHSPQFPLDGDMLVKVLTRKPYIRIPASAKVRESFNQGYNLMEKNPADPAARGILQFAEKLAGEFNIEWKPKTVAGGMSDLLSKVKSFFLKEKS